MKMQEIIFIGKCTAIITIAIAYISMDLGVVTAGELIFTANVLTLQELLIS